jgi:hypothetical protein
MFVSVMMPLLCNAQWSSRARYTTNDLYAYNYTTVSPAFAGTDGQKISFIGSMYAPKTTDYYGFGFAGYEARIDRINSGVGFTLSANSYVNQSFSDLSFLYNYQLDLDENSKLIVGARLTASQMAFDHSVVYPPDPADPIRYIGVSTARTTLGAAAVLYKHKKLFAGFSIDNLFRGKYRLHNLFGLQGYHDPQYNMIVGGSVGIGERSLTTHSVYVSNKNDYWRFDFNNSILIRNRFIGGLSLEINNSDHDNQIYPKVNAGIRAKGKAQFVFSVYSEAYNMGGKKFSGQLMMQFTL